MSSFPQGIGTSRGQASGRLFTARSIAIASAFGSLLVGAIFLSFNYIRFGDPRRALASIIAGLIIFVFLAASVVAVIPATQRGSFAPMVLTPIQAALAYWAARSFQGSIVEHHRDCGGEFFSDTRAAILSCGIIAGLMVGLALLAWWLAPAPAA